MTEVIYRITFISFWLLLAKKENLIDKLIKESQLESHCSHHKHISLEHPFSEHTIPELYSLTVSPNSLRSTDLSIKNYKICYSLGNENYRCRSPNKIIQDLCVFFLRKRHTNITSWKFQWNLVSGNRGKVAWCTTPKSNWAKPCIIHYANGINFYIRREVVKFHMILRLWIKNPAFLSTITVMYY